MQPHLSKDEEWILRYIGLNRDRGSRCDVLRANWPPGNKTRPNTKGMPANFDDAAICVDGLEKRQLVDYYTSDKGLHANLTGTGIDCLWELNNPDIVAKLQDLARRSPYTAYIILAALAIGAASGFISLLWKIFAAIW